MSDGLRREVREITSRGEWLWTCAACGSEFRTTRSRTRRFCSLTCSASFLARQWWVTDPKGMQEKIGKRNAARQAPLIDRFNAGYRVAENGCWIWQKALDSKGYGHIAAGLATGPDKAHRVAYRLYKGEIPPGLFVCHRCDTPRCVNPEHLFLGTSLNNTHDAMRKGRLRGGKLKGEAHGSAKLTQADVDAIRLSTESSSVLGARYGIRRQTVWAIRKGHTWKN